MSAAPPASPGLLGAVVARGLPAPESGQGRAGQRKGGGWADGAAHPGRVRHGTARRDLFPLSKHRRKAAGGRQGGRPGKVAAAYRRAGPLSASGCRVSHARGRPRRVGDKARDARLRRRPGPLPHSAGAAERSAAQPTALPQPARVTARCGAERREEPARRRAARQGRCLHAQRPGRRRAPVVAVTARSSARLPPPAPGTWSRIPSELRPVGQGRAGQAPFQYVHVCPNIVVGAHGSSGRI